MIRKEVLEKLYSKESKSCAEVGRILGCSEKKVDYWIKKHQIPKRSISDAIYVRCNPQGDPFFERKPETIDQAVLYGLGMGLYWGEGTKRNKHAVRLGNTDPQLIKKFIKFLEQIYNIDKKKLRFGLQIFSDMSPQKAKNFWKRELGAQDSQFQKVIVTPERGVGNYKHKTKHGVLTVYFNNKKLRDIICDTIEKM